MLSYYGDRKYKDREDLLATIKQAEVVAIDTESDVDGTFIGISVAWSPTESVFLSNIDFSFVADFLSCVPCVIHNVLYDYIVVRNLFNVNLQYKWDSMLMAQACGYPAALKDLSYSFDFNHSTIQSLLYENGVKVRGRTLLDCDLKEIAKLCCQHAIGSYKIWLALKNKTPESYDLDMRLLPTIIDMEDRGIRVDAELAREKAVELESDVKQLREQCKLLGFNPASPKQIGIALSEQGISLGFNRKSGMMKTDEEALMTVPNCPIASLVLAFRKHSKVLSTYVKPLLSIDRVYPRYHIVSTGRFASSPNVQNIPKALRDMYLPDEGDYFWSADAHQIEPRLMAWLSQDPKMLEDVLTGDIYQPIAERYHISRYTAKQLALASSYGAGAQKLVETSHRDGDNISLEEAEDLIHSYYQTYSIFGYWQVEAQEKAEVDGYVTTMFGRKRTLEGMLLGEKYDYNPLLKVVNSIVQGSAADILKLAMLRLKDYKISTTIHDDILISTNTNIDISILDNLTDMPLLWKVKTGPTWGNLS